VTRRLPILVAVSVLIGCTTAPPKADWAIYSEIIATRPAQITDLPRCLDLADPALAGDCALSVALGTAAAEGLLADAYCLEVPEGIWRSECYFIAAEKARSTGHPDQAIVLCGQAGSFAADCAFHLWQRSMRSMAKRIVLSEMHSQQDQMRRVHDRWSGRVDHISEFDSIFWRKLFRAVWDGVSRVDPEICGSLDADLLQWCRVGAKIHLDHALRASLRNDAWTSAFCAQAAPQIDDLLKLPEAFPELGRFPPHPAHQAVVDAFHRGQCQSGQLPPHPDPPRRTITGRSGAPQP